MASVRALGLLSGGLDSMLAVRLLQEQGIHVACVNFYTGFCIQSHTGAIRNPKPGEPPPRHDALFAAQQLGIRLHMVDISEEYTEIVINPKFGYGSNLNPCLDCKIFMIKKAWQLKEELGFDFIFTGEVVGQRPMSQRRDNFRTIARETGLGDWILRPLCALGLPPTQPELLGMVDRSRLRGINGRSRKEQMALAAQFGLVEYPNPAGGCCFLTDEAYSARLMDLWKTRGEKRYSMEEILLLKAGRHLRPAPHFKVIVGRDQSENAFLSGFKAGRIAVRAHGFPGPVVLVEGDLSEEDLTLACRLAARFGKAKGEPQVMMEIQREGEPVELRPVAPMPPEEIPDAWYL